MSTFLSVYRFYSLQLKRGMAWKWFTILGFIPSVIVIITLTLSSTEGWGSAGKAILFSEITLNYFFKFFILLVPLFYSTSVLAEEIEQQTIVFLFTLPIDRGHLLFAKFFSSAIHSLRLVGVSLLPTLILTRHHEILSISTIRSILIIWFSALIGTVCYASFSFLLGVILRHPMLVGLFFVFGWEQFVQFMPGFIQKLSIIYFVKSILPVALPEKASILILFQQSTSAIVSLIILICLSICFCFGAMYYAKKREYVMTNQ
jgi:ABC-2 type transport system permease protein